MCFLYIYVFISIIFTSKLLICCVFVVKSSVFYKLLVERLNEILRLVDYKKNYPYFGGITILQNDISFYQLTRRNISRKFKFSSTLLCEKLNVTCPCSAAVSGNAIYCNDLFNGFRQLAAFTTFFACDFLPISTFYNSVLTLSVP